ncbi:hypothetical protein GCM10023210_31060 [Chryseobacterium ginsengisoli]|uniref:Uncharacterized protein n=1 Tax=Chryseobacterium ginsengisoli TaxID=363853 RepID=A0ABP9MJL2_9FLAO
MRQFVAKNFKTGLTITFEYNYTDILQVLKFEGDWTEKQIEIMKIRFPASLEKMQEEMTGSNQSSAWIFAEITDISFDAFYKKYPRSIGRRELTEKAYNKLSDTDKLNAILGIEVLIKIKNDGTAFPYPATYLNQKQWK